MNDFRIDLGWMLSGKIAGGMSAWSIDRWSDYYKNIVQLPFASRKTNLDPDAATYIKKIRATDMQQGTVGKALGKDIQVIVQDYDMRPVQGAQVIFSIKAGGGRLIASGNSEKLRSIKKTKNSLIATTDNSGIAKAKLILGECTGECEHGQPGNATYIK